MRVLFCIRSLDPAGAEKQLVVLANGLARKGHEVAVAVCYSGGSLESSLKNVELIHLEKTGRWDILFLRRFLGCVRRFSPDVVHGYLGLGNMLAAVSKSWLRGKGVVWGVRASNMDFSRYDAGARLSSRIERFLARFADAVIANSRAGAEHAVRHGYPAEVVHVVPNGIDTGVYRPEPALGRALRQEIGVADSDVLFGLVARVDVMKGHDVFLRAAADVAIRHPEARFLCVGRSEGAFARKMRDMAASLPELAGRLHWLDAQSDLLPVYGAIDVLVSASRFGEGFSNVLGEAMACGVPCLTTNVGDAREIVGDTGIVVAPEDPDALGKGMGAFLAMNRDFSPESIRNRITSFYGTERLITSTEAILAELA